MEHSPASSPRLPSPPPMAEDQTGPVSPGAAMMEEYSKIGTSSNTDQSASRRIRPGTKSEDMLEGPPLVELQEIDSAFQLTEHLKALHASHTRPASSPASSIPIDKPTAQSLAHPPPGIDRGIWLYELCRFLVQKANVLAIGLFSSQPPCSAATCPEMRASEWQYLCAAHDPPKSCAAIDYVCHTLDWAAATLTSSKLFPSRLALGTEAASSAQQVRKMTEIFRRVYRIFAHAWFAHRDVFWRVEGKTGLYVFFKTVCDEYRLIPEDNYTIPPEAEGVDVTPVAEQMAAPSLLRREGAAASAAAEMTLPEPVGNATVATGNTTKRHRSTAHARSSSVSTVIQEEVEDEGEEAEHEDWQKEEPASRGQVTEIVSELHDEEMQEDAARAGDDHGALTADDTEKAYIPPFPRPRESDEEHVDPFTTKDGNGQDDQETEDKSLAQHDAVIDVMDPQSAAAGQGEEASQSVGD